MGFYYLLNSSKDYQKIKNEDKKDEEKEIEKQKSLKKDSIFNGHFSLFLFYLFSLFLYHLLYSIGNSHFSFIFLFFLLSFIFQYLLLTEVIVSTVVPLSMILDILSRSYLEETGSQFLFSFPKKEDYEKEKERECWKFLDLW